MILPVRPPLTPMLAAPSPTIPEGMAYEPKWDGFRALAFRDGDEVRLFSRSGSELTAYFPEIIDPVRQSTPAQCVLDGELVIIDGNRLSFTRLLERNGASASKVARLAKVLPASLIAFDLLALGEQSLLDQPYRTRRALLEQSLSEARPPVLLGPMTTEVITARTWFDQFEGNGLDGVMAKPFGGRYRAGERAMYKIKHRRDADVVIGGFRLHKRSTPQVPLLGVLHLGAFNDQGQLAWVGACSGFSDGAREQLLEVLLPLTLAPGDPAWESHPWSRPAQADGPRHPLPGPRSGGADQETYLLAPELVCEITFDHLEDDGRFRSSPRFLRFRPDKLPSECTFAQFHPRLAVDLRSVLHS